MKKSLVFYFSYIIYNYISQMNIFFRAKLDLIQTDEYQMFCCDFCMYIYDVMVKQLMTFQNVVFFIL